MVAPKTASQKKAAEAKRKIVYNTTKEVARREAESQFARTFKVPEGMQTFKFKAAKRYRLRAIPHIVGNANPHCDEGLVHYELTFYTHPQLGPKNETIVCGQCFKDEDGNPKPCAVCDNMAALRRAGRGWEDIKHLAPKRRQLWYFEDQDDLQPGIQVFEASYFGKGQGFGEMIQNKLDLADEDSPKHNFFHLDGGSLITVLTKEDKFQGRVFYKPVSLELDVHKKVYPDTILDKLPPLESLLVETSYEKAEAMLGGGAPPEEGEETQAEEQEETQAEEQEETTAEAETEEEAVEETEEVEVEEESAEDETVEEVEIGPGSRVQYEYKGETRTGTVSKVVEEKGLLHVKIDGKEGPPSAVKMDDPTLTVIQEEEEAAPEEEVEVEEEPAEETEEEFVEEEEVEVEEEPVKPAPKKPGAGASGGKPGTKASPATPAKKVIGKK